jgi:hypothetical protein
MKQSQSERFASLLEFAHVIVILQDTGSGVRRLDYLFHPGFAPAGALKVGAIKRYSVGISLCTKEISLSALNIGPSSRFPVLCGRRKSSTLPELQGDIQCLNGI